MVQNLISFLTRLYVGTRGNLHRRIIPAADEPDDEGAEDFTGAASELGTIRMEYNRLAIDLARYERVGLSLMKPEVGNAVLMFRNRKRMRAFRGVRL